MTTISTLVAWWRRSSPPASRLAISGILALVSGLASLILLGGSGVLVVRATEGGGLAALGGLLVAIELVAFFRAPLRLRERIGAHRVALGSMVRWRAWLFDTIADRTPGSLDLSSGELLDRTIEDVDALQDLYVRITLPVVAALATGLLAAIWTAFVLPLAGVVLAATVLVGIGVAFLIAITTGRNEAAAADARSDVAAATVDLLAGMVELVMVDGTASALERINRAERARARFSLRQAWWRGIGLAVQTLIVGGAVLGVIYLAGRGVASGSVTPAGAAGIGLMTVAALEPLASLIAAGVRAPEVAASGRRLDDLAAIDPSSVEPAAPVAWPSSPLTIELAHVSARQGAGAKDILRDVSVTLAPGSRTALLGASGAGKSTLSLLLLRLLQPTGGVITVGGVDLADLSGDDVRSHATILDQRPALFGGTLRDALRLGAPDASDASMLDALEACHLAELLKPSEGGLDRRITEGGSTLSGGQRQRLALARALLRAPDLLILDEPTVGLDPTQGAEVLDAAFAAAGGATILLITHDIEEASQCDRVLWLSDGQVAELEADEIQRLRQAP